MNFTIEILGVFAQPEDSWIWFQSGSNVLNQILEEIGRKKKLLRFVSQKLVLVFQTVHKNENLNPFQNLLWNRFWFFFFFWEFVSRIRFCFGQIYADSNLTNLRIRLQNETHQYESIRIRFMNSWLNQHFYFCLLLESVAVRSGHMIHNQKKNPFAIYKSWFVECCDWIESVIVNQLDFAM